MAAMARQIVDEDLLGEPEFARVAKFIQDTTGIKVPPGKKLMVEGRLRKRVRALGLASLDDYCKMVFERGGFDQESTYLINAVTTNKTDFFREPSHFTFLREVVLPEARDLGIGFNTPFTAWSAASSIGAEPYTLAMVLADFAQADERWRFSVLASDISTDVLTKAAKAIYSEEQIEPVPMEMRKRYLLRSIDPAKKLVRIAPELRRTLSFFRLNLMDGSYPVDRAVDVIFCRNILIYFDNKTQEQVIDRLVRHLRPGGYLFLGHTEGLSGKSSSRLTWRGDSVFQKDAS